MIYPPRLKAGDTVAIVAPARKISPPQLEAALVTLQRWGLKPKLSQNIFSSGHAYLAGTDDERRRDFQAMLDDDDVKAIFCARGGYGSTRIIEDLDFAAFQSHPKWIIGFSDVTAFHLLAASMDIASIHATMPIFFDQAEAHESVESIRQILFEGSCKVSAVADPSNRPGRAAGQVVGGNLSLIVDALNTAAEPDTSGRILVIEEVDEYFYKLDRMMTQLRRAGKLKHLAGLLVGHLSDMKNSDLAFGESASQIVLHAVRDYSFPVAFSFPSGHRNPNLAWIHGAPADLDVSVNKTLLSYERLSD